MVDFFPTGTIILDGTSIWYRVPLESLKIITTSPPIVGLRQAFVKIF